MSEEIKIPVTCVVTGRTAEVKPLKDGSPGLPPGWHRLGGEYYSPEGWARKFVPRSIRLPVASVVAVDGVECGANEGSREAWKLFRQCLKISWHQATQAANWLMTELAKCDNAPLLPPKPPKEGLLVLDPTDSTAEFVPLGPKHSPRLPPLELPMNALLKRLYDFGREHCPDLDSQSLSSVRQRVMARYKEDRWEVRVRGSKSLPSFRYPYPVPVPAATYTLDVNEQNQPFVTCRLAGHRFTVRLRNGSYHGNKGPSFDFRPQVANLKRVVAGELLAGELSVFERATSGSQHRNGGGTRVQAGGNWTPTEIVYSFTVWLPRENGERTEKKLVVKTCADHLWSVFLEGREQLWDLHEDQLKSLIVGYRARLFRISHDAKFERRVPKAAGAGLASLRERLSRQNQKRVDDLLHKAARMLANFAQRNKVSEVEYDDSEQNWCPALPFFKLRNLSKEKVEKNGISFAHANGSDENEAG